MGNRAKLASVGLVVYLSLWRLFHPGHKHRQVWGNRWGDPDPAILDRDPR